MLHHVCLHIPRGECLRKTEVSSTETAVTCLLGRPFRWLQYSLVLPLEYSLFHFVLKNKMDDALYIYHIMLLVYNNFKLIYIFYFQGKVQFAFDNICNKRKTENALKPETIYENRKIKCKCLPNDHIFR